MTLEDWVQLEALCRKVLEDTPNVEMLEHPLYQAVRTTGAFAKAVSTNMEGT